MSARRKVMGHLKHLMAAGTALTVSDEAVASAPPPAAHSPDASVASDAGTPMTRPPDPAYGVVDPLPMPARCPPNAAQLMTYRPKKLKDGKLELTVTAKPDTYQSVHIRGMTCTSGGKLESATNGSVAYVAVLAPSGADAVVVNADVQCGVGSTALSISIDPATLGVTVHEGR